MPKIRPSPTSRATTFLATLLAMAAALPVLATAGPWQENEQSRVRLISPWTTAPANGELMLGLEFETIPGWHVYWKNSGDAGYPPALDFGLTPEIASHDLLWPAPERYHLPGDLVALGYEGQVVYPVRVVLDTQATSFLDSLPIAVEVDYLVCEVDCIPYLYTLELEQALATDGAEAVEDPELAGLLAVWRERVPRPVAEIAGADTTARLDLTDPETPALEVRFTGLTPAANHEPELFLEAHETFDAEPPQRLAASDSGEIAFRVPLAFRVRPDSLPSTADFAWTLTGAATPDGQPMPVEARRTVEAATADGAPASRAAGSDAPGDAPAALLLWAFVGGLLLAATPSVLPLTILGAATVAARPQPPPAALATTAGLALGGLGLAAWAATDPTLTWGRQLQSPLPVTALILATTLLALHLWGLLRLPLATRRTEEEAPPLSAFALTGLAMVGLALTWDLPPLARSLGPALAANSSPGLGMAAALAAVAGLAVPFVAAAALPGLARALAPASREPWAHRLAEAGGFLQAASVLWLLYLLARQVTGEGVAYVQLALLAVALVAWLRHTARRPAMAAALAVVLLLLAATVLWLATDSALATAQLSDPPVASSDATSSVTSSTPTPKLQEIQI